MVPFVTAECYQLWNVSLKNSSDYQRGFPGCTGHWNNSERLFFFVVLFSSVWAGSYCSLYFKLYDQLPSVRERNSSFVILINSNCRVLEAVRYHIWLNFVSHLLLLFFYQHCHHYKSPKEQPVLSWSRRPQSSYWIWAATIAQTLDSPLPSSATIFSREIIISILLPFSMSTTHPCRWY